MAFSPTQSKTSAVLERLTAGLRTSVRGPSLTNNMDCRSAIVDHVPSRTRRFISRRLVRGTLSVGEHAKNMIKFVGLEMSVVCGAEGLATSSAHGLKNTLRIPSTADVSIEFREIIWSIHANNCHNKEAMNFVNCEHKFRAQCDATMQFNMALPFRSSRCCMWETKS